MFFSSSLSELLTENASNPTIMTGLLADAVKSNDISGVEIFLEIIERSQKIYNKAELINQKNEEGKTLLQLATSIDMARILIKNAIDVVVDPVVLRYAQMYCDMYQKTYGMLSLNNNINSVDMVAKTVVYLNMPETQALDITHKARWSSFMFKENIPLFQTWLSTKKEPNPELYIDPNKVWLENPSFLSEALNRDFAPLVALVIERLQAPEVDFQRDKNCDLIEFILYQGEAISSGYIKFIVDKINRLDILKELEKNMLESLASSPELQPCIDMAHKKIEAIIIKKEKDELNQLVPTPHNYASLPTEHPVGNLKKIKI